MPSEELIRKWHRFEILNTVAGLVVSALAVVFLPAWAVAIVVTFMVLAVADTWYLGRRFRRGHGLLRVRRPRN